MKNKHGLIGLIVSIVLASMPNVALAQQTPAREPVIGINDELEIRVWTQLMEARPDFSMPRVVVRSDGKIPMAMPQLDDVQAAGLKISSLKKKLESQESIGKLVISPQVKVAILKPSDRIQITLTGNTSQTVEILRGATLGAILSGLSKVIPNVQEFGLDAETAFVRSAEGEEFPFNPNLRLEWGDEITSKSQPPSKSTNQASPEQMPRSIQFTAEEMQQYFEQFPAVKETLKPLLMPSEDGKSVTIDLGKISEKDQQALGKEALQALMTHISAAAAPLADAILAGINVDLTSTDNLEAFFLIPNPNPEKQPQIKRFKKGDILVKKSSAEEDVMLKDIQDNPLQVILQKGKELQSQPLSGEKFINVALAGIFEQGDKKHALFANLKPTASKKPLKRMFQEEDELDEQITVAEIGDTWVLLKNGKVTPPQWQLVLLRDAFSRPAPSPKSSSPSSQEQPQQPDQAGANPQTAPTMPAMPDAMKKQLQALNMFSKIFLATPMF